MRNSSLSQKAGMCSEGCPARARALSLPGPRPPGSSCPGDRGSPESEGITRLLLRSAPAPSEPGSRSAAGRPHPAPTCSTKALGQIVKPRSAAGPRDSHTAAASSLGLSRIRGSVREAPRRTSPKQRKGDLQKWLRDRTAGDAASSSARGPLGPARGLGSGGLRSQQPLPRCQVAIEASGTPGCSERPPQERPQPPLEELRGSRNNSPPFSSSCQDTRRRPDAQTQTGERRELRRDFAPFKIPASTNGLPWFRPPPSGPNR